MENKEILQKLLSNLALIKEIKTDDGYVIHRVASIGSSSIELLKQLQTDDEEDKQVISKSISDLLEVNLIEKRYYADSQYKQWIRKETPFGNMHIFMDAINCVEGELEVFLHKVGLLKSRK